MIPYLSFIGDSNSGKTTLLRGVIGELSRRGYKVATVKHDRSHGFQFDKEGKDSWKHKEAGAFCSIMASPSRLAFVRDSQSEISLEEIVRRYGADAHILIAEGYKEGSHPKIELCHDKQENELRCRKDKSIIALIREERVSQGLPCFSRDDAGSVASWIEERFLGKGKYCSVALNVNGRNIPLKPFIANMLAGAIRGVICSLKGCGKAEHIEVVIDGEKENV